MPFTAFEHVSTFLISDDRIRPQAWESLQVFRRRSSHQNLRRHVGRSARLDRRVPRTPLHPLPNFSLLKILRKRVNQIWKVPRWLRTPETEKPNQVVSAESQNEPIQVALSKTADTKMNLFAILIRRITRWCCCCCWCCCPRCWRRRSSLFVKSPMRCHFYFALIRTL